MARFMPDGTPDPTFGDEGISIVYPPGNLPPVGNRMELLADGSTLQFGTAHWNSGPPVIVKRLPDGSPDSDFGTDGVLVVPTGNTNEKFLGGAYMPGGGIIAYGGGGGSVIAAKLTQNAQAGGFVDLGEDIFFCEGDSILVDAGNPGSTFEWSNGATSQSIAVTAEGTLSVTVTTPDGCTGTDAIEVTVHPLPEVPVIQGENGYELSTGAEGDVQWFLNGEPIPEATGSNWVAMENGSYTVTVTDQNGCSSTSEAFEVTVVGTSAHDKSRIIIWPNPAADVINLGDAQTFIAVEAIDMAGRVLLLSPRNDGSISVSQLSRGAYVLRARSAEGVFIGRFVKY